MEAPAVAGISNELKPRRLRDAVAPLAPSLNVSTVAAKCVPVAPPFGARCCTTNYAGMVAEMAAINNKYPGVQSSEAVLAAASCPGQQKCFPSPAGNGFGFACGAPPTTPALLQQLYSIPATPPANVDPNLALGIYEKGSYFSLDDLDKATTAWKVPSVTPAVYYGTNNGSTQCANAATAAQCLEASLDTQIASFVAQGVPIGVWFNDGETTDPTQTGVGHHMSENSHHRK